MNTDLIKEVYAQFGLAYYSSEIIHRGLSNIYITAFFKNRKDVTVPRIEERMHYAFNLTLGKIIEEVKDFVSIELWNKLKDVKERRNYLAHHFWFDKINLLFTKEGTERLCSFLQNEILFFDSINDKIEEIEIEQRRRLGIPDEVIQGYEWEPIKKQRPLRKKEVLIAVWEFETDNGRPLIFELEDGSLWQLSDIGLGWTSHSQKEALWSKNIQINAYLPSAINPRPETKEPWNYSFELKKGRELWVKKSEKEKKFIWGINDRHFV